MSSSQAAAKKTKPIHTKILLALVFGAAVGVTCNLTAGPANMEGVVSKFTEPIGRMWLNALIMIVIPLILATLSLGVVGLGDLRTLGRIGLITIVAFVTLTALSTTLGLVAMNVFRPGAGLPAPVRDRLMETYQGEAKGAMGLASSRFGVELFVRIIPRNPIQAMANGEMLAVIFVALMLGVALLFIGREKAEPLLRLMESLGHVVVAIIDLVMRVAPLGVFCLVFSVTARFGHGLLLQLLKYMLVVIGSLAAFLFAVYPLVLRVIARRNPWEFFRKIRLAMLTAFSTSSSNATLPTSMRVAEQELGFDRAVSGFVLPLGATMNMNGTALFEGATVLFLAQVFGVHLTLASQLIVVVMSVLMAIGTAGIPSGSIPLLMIVLQMVGVPAEGIAIVLGVDRLLDMCRTTLNVTGDLVTAAIVQRLEKSRPN
ncbi:MAG: dicarboxylate/amino acid:cation symporter [Verrucomicrobiae bacterium]|nr:dicarboxylate/amino acid:cation symporter [Verrucomicrobiae bacterium]